jgi:hypothetical protein
MSIKSQSMVALFLALVVSLALNPTIINNIYENVLGRIVLICIVIFFAINNTTLGLLVVLVIIAALNQYGSFTEGFKLNKELKKGEKEEHSILSKGEPDLTKGEPDLTKGEPDLTKGEEHDFNPLNKHKLKKISNLKKEQETTGVNLQDLRNTTMPKDSNTIQVDKNMIRSEEVSPSTSSMLNSSLKENFSILNTDY